MNLSIHHIMDPSSLKILLAGCYQPRIIPKFTCVPAYSSDHAYKWCSLKFYFALVIVYTLIGTSWALICWKYKLELLPIQVCSSLPMHIFPSDLSCSTILPAYTAFLLSKCLLIGVCHVSLIMSYPP